MGLVEKGKKKEKEENNFIYRFNGNAFKQYGGAACYSGR